MPQCSYDGLLGCGDHTGASRTPRGGVTSAPLHKRPSSTPGREPVLSKCSEPLSSCRLHVLELCPEGLGQRPHHTVGFTVHPQNHQRPHCPASCSIQGGRGLDLKLGLSLPSYACEVSSLSHWMRSLQSPTTSSGFSSPANVIPASCLASARHMAFPTSPLYDCFHILMIHTTPWASQVAQW